ncbi:N-acetyl-gamma-glutamyl-phosphate reductase [Aliidiomarina quisquiliarum]|uniref:N-acetyl-gamma-glutamyl-phosphate reductase n=1 Tax=Aliidiomarina quisquiliarum TaxID=2938947 RepID=UPI00208FBAE1|nr:N-acetyl-gamma-glutamyl-phosphate reductase [Aliidiomarina quisquiliarum]
MNNNVVSEVVPSAVSCVVLGATGYVGSELLALLHKNTNFTVVKAFSSAEREPVAWRAVAPQLAGNSSLIIEPWHINQLSGINVQAAFLALPHEASALIAPVLLSLGIKVFDLSGAFRFQDADVFANAYGFEHPSPQLLANAQYMLMPWLKNTVEPSVYAIPGCYPTAAILGLKPLVDAGLVVGMPVITAISGVTGAGKGANARTSFCEVSMQAYGVLNHRHQPEISQQLGTEVVFTPVLGPYARGILAVCTVQLNTELLNNRETPNALHELYRHSYAQNELVMVVNQPPAVNHVAHTAFCHVHVAHNEHTAVVTVAIDNLIMGAAGQAMQAANQVFGVDLYAGLK